MTDWGGGIDSLRSCGPRSWIMGTGYPKRYPGPSQSQSRVFRDHDAPVFDALTCKSRKLSYIVASEMHHHQSFSAIVSALLSL